MYYLNPLSKLKNNGKLLYDVAVFFALLWLQSTVIFISLRCIKWIRIKRRLKAQSPYTETLLLFW